MGTCVYVGTYVYLRSCYALSSESANTTYVLRPCGYVTLMDTCPGPLLPMRGEAVRTIAVCNFRRWARKEEDMRTHVEHGDVKRDWNWSKLLYSAMMMPRSVFILRRWVNKPIEQLLLACSFLLLWTETNDSSSYK